MLLFARKGSNTVLCYLNEFQVNPLKIMPIEDKKQQVAAAAVAVGLFNDSNPTQGARWLLTVLDGCSQRGEQRTVSDKMAQQSV